MDALVALERLAPWTAARQIEVLAAMADDQFAGTLAPSLERSWVKEEVRAALGESSLGANGRLRDATDLVHVLPGPQDGDPEAPMPVMASFRRKLRRAVMKADPRTAEEKAARAVEDRDERGSPRQ